MSYTPPIGDASLTKKGMVQLSGDLSGSADSPTVPGLAAKADASEVYTKAEIDSSLATKAYNSSALAGKADTTSVYTKSAVDSNFIPASQKGANSGVASLDSSGKVPSSQLPEGAAQQNADWNATGGVSEILNKPILAVATSAKYTDLINTPTFATVATSGSYSDLTGRPTLGTAASTDSTAYATAAQGTKADAALLASDVRLNGLTTFMVSVIYFDGVADVRPGLTAAIQAAVAHITTTGQGALCKCP